MTGQEAAIEPTLRAPAVLLLLGLGVEAASLLWQHPTAFVLFLVAGGSLIAAGTLLYLNSLLPRSR